MQIHWTRRAIRRVDQHISYIALHSPKAADALAQRIFGAVEHLLTNPLLGREGRYLGTRELVIAPGRYVVIYRIRNQTVQIISVHDTRRPWPAAAEDL